MKTKKCSVNKLNRIVKKKRIICYGAGQALISFCNNYKHYNIIDKIDYIVDNDPQKQNKTIDILGRRISIFSYEYLLENISNNNVIVITNRNYATEISEQVSKEPKLKKVYSFFLPEVNFWSNKIMHAITSVLPLRNVLVFQGPDEFCDNGYAIRDYMLKKEDLQKYKFVWNVDRPEDFKKSRNQIYIQRNADKYSKSVIERFKYIYYFSVAKYIFYESAPLSKTRKNQNLVFLGHGAFSLKKSKGIIVTSKDVDYVVCPSENCINGVCEQTRSFPEQIIICGSPRNDVLFSDKPVIHNLIDHNKYDKIIIWMPTLRQASWSNRMDSTRIFPYGVPLISSQKELEGLKKVLREKNYCLLIKPHPFQRLTVFNNLDSTDEIRIVFKSELKQKNIDLYNLLKDTDALITDYSSVSFDYMLLDKPIAYALDDMDDYKIGFAMDNPLDYMPGHHLRTYDDLLAFFNDIDNDKYKEERNKLCDFIHKYRDGNNAERLLKMIGIEER